MTEYIIIVALIAIAAIGVYSFFGQTSRQPAPVTAQEQSGKAMPKDTQPPAGQPAKSETKGAAGGKSAVVTK